jgi:hypothetical protein
MLQPRVFLMTAALALAIGVSARPAHAQDTQQSNPTTQQTLPPQGDTTEPQSTRPQDGAAGTTGTTNTPGTTNYYDTTNVPGQPVNDNVTTNHAGLITIIALIAIAIVAFIAIQASRGPSTRT